MRKIAVVVGGVLVTVEAEPWMGNYLPWRGVVEIAGMRLGVSGGCKGEGRALDARADPGMRTGRKNWRIEL